MHFRLVPLAMLAVTLTIVSLHAAAAEFEPRMRADAVSVYVYRDAKPASGQLPPAAGPMLSINGQDQATLPWGSAFHSFLPSGEIELVVRKENNAAWSFGRFGTRFDGTLGTVRYFKLEIVETAPEAIGSTIRRNWRSMFREMPEAEARRSLRSLPLAAEN